LYDLDTLHL
jgi:hypothetical protein